MWIGVLEAARGVEQPRARGPRRAAPSLDPPAQKLDARDVVGPGPLELDVTEDGLGRLPLSADLRRVGRREQPAEPPGGLSAQRRRPLVPLDGGDRPAAQPHIRGKPLDRGGELLVGLRRGGRPMCDPLPLELGLDARRGQHVVGTAPVGAGRRRVHRRADQRVAEPEPPGLEHDQPGVLGRGEGVIGEPRARERAADHDRAVGPARGQEEHRLAARVGQGLDHAGVGLLEARAAAFEAPAVGARELEQRERVPGGIAHRLVEAVRRQPTVLEQRAGLVGRQQLRADGRQLGVALRARRDQEGDAICGDAPPGKRDRLRRRRVKPVGVVDQREHRLLLRSGAEQVEGADEHRQPVDRLGRPDGERAPQRLGLASRQVRRKTGERCEEVDEPDERHRCLGLDAPRPHHAHVLGARGGVLEERGLADPRLARDDERAAVAPARVVEQPIDTQALLPPAHKHAAECTDCRKCRERS